MAAEDEWDSGDFGDVAGVHPQRVILGSKGLEVDRQLGRGQYGTAHLVRWSRSPAPALEGLPDDCGSNEAVAKVVLLDQLKDKDRALALQEVELLRRLRHPNVVRHYTSWRHGGSGRGGAAGLEALVTVMEYCAGGDMRALLEARARGGAYLAESTVLSLFTQLLLGMRYVHAQKILHRDLKTSNMLLDASQRVVKIGDFGIARVLESTVAVAITTLGTPYYMSPEVCKGEPYREKSDMWSLGCVLYEMCVLRHAFESQSLLGLVYCIVSERYDPVPVDRYSPAVGALVAALLAKAAEDRPSAAQALDSEVVKPYLEAGGTAAVEASACPPPPPPVMPGATNPGPEPPPTPRGSGDEGSWSTDPPPAAAAAAPRPPAAPPRPPPPVGSGEAVPPATPRGAGESDGSGAPSAAVAGVPSPDLRPAKGLSVGNCQQRPWTEAAAAALGFFANPAPWAEAGDEVKVALGRLRSALLRRHRARGNWIQAFAAQDALGRGALSRSEFEAFLMSLNARLSQQEVAAVTECLAGTRGVISLGSFSEAMTNAGKRQSGEGGLDESWAAGLIKGLLAAAPPGEAPDQAFTRLLATLEPTAAARLPLWLPKTPDGAVDWAAAQEWCAT